MLNKNKRERIWFIDEIRGFCIICMIIYHAFFNIIVLKKLVYIPFFDSFVMYVVKITFVMIFVLISGSVSQLSRSNIRRGFICLLIALGITVITFIADSDYAIWFGILHMLGTSMVLYGLLRKYLNKINIVAGIIISFLLFAVTYGVPYGYAGFPYLMEIKLPDFLYSTGFLFPIGFPNSDFNSGDYFSLVPWFFLFICGACLGIYAKEKKLPGFFYKKHINALAFAGRNTLIIYILHQPVLIFILWILEKAEII